jgi:hypothetical protein
MSYPVWKVKTLLSVAIFEYCEDTVNSGRYVRLILQAGHSPSLYDVCCSFTISTAVLNRKSQNHAVSVHSRKVMPQHRCEIFSCRSAIYNEVSSKLLDNSIKMQCYTNMHYLDA